MTAAATDANAGGKLVSKASRTSASRKLSVLYHYVDQHMQYLSFLVIISSRCIKASLHALEVHN